MKITPRNGLVTVRFLEPRQDTMVGKIHVPAASGNQFKMAEIVEVGRGSPDYGKFVGTEDLRPGQTVLVKSGTQVDIGNTVHNYIHLKDDAGHDLAVLNQQDIMAIIKDADEVTAEANDEAMMDVLADLAERGKAELDKYLETGEFPKADNSEGENNESD